MKKTKFYAVRNGKKCGIFSTWDECREQIHGYSGAEYKSFPTREEALAYLNREESEITLDPDCAVAYVDGSYLHRTRQFSFGAILLYQGKEQHFKLAFSDPELAAMRNVAGEIKGAEFIMRYCAEHEIHSLELYYDYEGIEKWCTGAWSANKEGTKRYAAFYQSIKNRVQVRFVKVRGHSGVEYNELADALAKSALGIE